MRLLCLFIRAMHIAASTRVMLICLCAQHIALCLRALCWLCVCLRELNCAHLLIYSLYARSTHMRVSISVYRNQTVDSLLMPKHSSSHHTMCDVAETRETARDDTPLPRGQTCKNIQHAARHTIYIHNMTVCDCARVCVSCVFASIIVNSSRAR